MRKEFDVYEERVDTAKKLIEVLKTQEGNTVRKEVAAKDISFVTVDRALHHYQSNAKLAKRIGVEEEVLDDTIKHTNLVCVIEKEPFLLGNSTWISLKNRINIYGEGFDILSADSKAKVLTERFRQLGEKTVKVMVVHDKIRSIMSAEYAVMEMSLLFETVLEKTEERFDEILTETAWVNQNIAHTKIQLLDLAEEVNSLYNIPDDFIPGILIESSDTGFSSSKVTAYWKKKKGGSFRLDDESIQLVHKGSNGLDKVKEELPNLFLRYQNVVKKLASLMTEEIEQPIKVLRESAKRIGLTKKVSIRIVENFQLSHQPGDRVTAYDLCRELMDAPLYVEASLKPDTEKKAGKSVNIPYKKLDEEAGA